LKREAVLKNPTFSRFTHCKSVFSFALNNFISAFFACIFFIYTRFENTHEAIISNETFEKAQQYRAEIAKKSKSKNKIPYTENVLKGKIYCQCCGKNLNRGREITKTKGEI